MRAGGSSSQSAKSSSKHPNVRSKFSFQFENLLPLSIGTWKVPSIKAEGIAAITKKNTLML
jgi:hypothetical protein